MVTIENIQKTVADYYKIRVSDLSSSSRLRAIAQPRQVAMALAKELTQLSLPNIGDAFGGRDHTNVRHAIQTIKPCQRTTMNRITMSLFYRKYCLDGDISGKSCGLTVNKSYFFVLEKVVQIYPHPGT